MVLKAVLRSGGADASRCRQARRPSARPTFSGCRTRCIRRAAIVAAAEHRRVGRFAAAGRARRPARRSDLFEGQVAQRRQRQPQRLHRRARPAAGPALPRPRRTASHRSARRVASRRSCRHRRAASTASRQRRRLLTIATRPTRSRRGPGATIPDGQEIDVRLERELSSGHGAGRGSLRSDDRRRPVRGQPRADSGRLGRCAASSARSTRRRRTDRKGSLTVAFDQVTVRGRDYPMRGTVTQALESEGIKGEVGQDRRRLGGRRDHRRHPRRRERRAARRPDRRRRHDRRDRRQGRHAAARHHPPRQARQPARHSMKRVPACRAGLQARHAACSPRYVDTAFIALLAALIVLSTSFSRVRARQEPRFELRRRRIDAAREHRRGRTGRTRPCRRVSADW